MSDVKLGVDQVNLALTRLILACFAGIVFLGALGFFFQPPFPDAPKLALDALSEFIIFAIGAKAGYSMPQALQWYQQKQQKPPEPTEPKV